MSDEDDYHELESVEQDVSYSLTIVPNQTQYVWISPLDEAKFLSIRIAFSSFNPPAGSAGDTLTWTEAQRYNDRRNRWNRVLVLENTLSSRTTAILSLREVKP